MRSDISNPEQARYVMFTFRMEIAINESSSRFTRASLNN